MSKTSGYANQALDGSNNSLATVIPDKLKDQVGKDEDTSESKNERGNWGGQLEFILTCVGYAVGLGNVWRFPYLCYRNGGGAFLIPYFLMLSLVGLPLFYLENAFGQFASLGPISIWNINPMMKGVGYGMVIVCILIGLYYNVIITWSIYYFFASMTSELPWTYCDNLWNTENCLTSDFIKEHCIGNGSLISCDDGRLMNRSDIKTPSEEYFYNQVLRLSDGIEHMGPISWKLATCLSVAWVIVFLVLIKGISSLGKVVYFSSILPYILLTIMLIRGVTLPGASVGIEYYLRPDFSKLTESRVWSDAATQIFYSIGTCDGGLIAMASYNKFHNNCFRDAMIVPFINCATSFYAGFVIFSVLGFMAVEKGVSVDEVAESGPGLAFVVYPEGITQMPVAPLWAILFFFMLITLGFSSEFSMVECFFSSITDELPGFLRKSRKINIAFRAICVIAFWFITLSMVTEGGFYLLNLLDVMLGGFPLLIEGLLELFALSYIYGYNNFADDIALMLGSKPGIFWKFTWCVLSPAILLILTVSMAAQYSAPTLFENYEYPGWAQGVGWGVVVFSLIPIPVIFIYRLLAGGAWKLMVKGMKPSPKWGPAKACDRNGKYALKYVDMVTNKGEKFEKMPAPFPILSNKGNPRESAIQPIPDYNEVIKTDGKNKSDPYTHL